MFITLIIKILWLLFISLIYLLPLFSPAEVEQTLQLGFRIDYLLHAGVFFLTGIVFFLRSRKMGLWLATFAVYSLALELAQKFLASRTFNPLDFLANILGLILAYFFMKYLNRRIYG